MGILSSLELALWPNCIRFICFQTIIAIVSSTGDYMCFVDDIVVVLVIVISSNKQKQHKKEACKIFPK